MIFGVVPENNFIEGWARRRFVENCSNRHKFLHQEHDPLRENRFKKLSNQNNEMKNENNKNENAWGIVDSVQGVRGFNFVSGCKE